MAEYVNSKEEAINVGEPIIFENKTEASFDVSLGVVFRKSGLYRVSMYGKNVSIQKEPERMRGKWIPHHDKVMLFDGMSIGGMACSVCGWKTHNKMHLIFGCPYKYCPSCGSQMEENEHHTVEEFMQGQDTGNPEDGSL